MTQSVLVNPAAFEFCHIFSGGAQDLYQIDFLDNIRDKADDAPPMAGIPRSTLNNLLCIPDNILSSIILFLYRTRCELEG
jgi:hypothetical protein